MPINKPTISHQLKTVKSNKPKSSVIHSIPSVAFSPQNRSHLVSSNSNQKQSTYFNKNLGNVIDSSNISNTDLKECTKLLRNVLSSEENKSTSTDDFNCHKQQQQLNTRSVAFKSPDLSSGEDQFIYNACNQTQIIEGSDDRTDAESLTSIPDQKLTLINNNNSVNEKSVYSPSSNITYSNYCNCHSKNNNYPMHESKLNHNSSDTTRVHEKISICMRCHNIIPPTKTISKEQETIDILHNKSADEYLTNKSSHDDYPNHHNIPITINNKDFKQQYQCHDVPGDKFDDFISLIHMKISELQSISRVTRDADLGRVICEIERGFQQMIRENSLLLNHLKTISKTLKWENSALKQKIKNQTETNRDMKSELKLIRQEQKQKIEELKLEVQLKSEEIRQLTERDKTNICQLKDKYNTLEKEHEKLRCEFQGQILQACHKDTEIIQLKHSCSQIEAKLKEEIHSLSLNNQHLKQELNSSQNQCRKYEQDLNHNQSIIKAAREQVFNLLDRHKQNRLENTNTSYRYEPSSELSMSGEWIHQASNIQQVLSMACDNKDKQSPQSADKYNNNNNMTSTPIWPINYYSPNQQPSDQSNATNASNNNFATTNFNNNYISSSSYNPINSDCTNPVSSYDNIHSKKKTNIIDCDRSLSPSNVSSTLSNHSLNLSFNNNNDHTNINNILDKRRSNIIDSRRCSESSNSDANDDPWCLPQPFHLKKMSSASSMMSTVSSLRSTDDREFRNGLQRLDTQISRLQNTLQSNLQCK